MMNRPTALPGIAAITFFMQSLDTTMLYLAIPAMAISLHQSALSMGIIVAAYLLTVAMFTPISGWLNDRFGFRRTYLVSLALFAGGSAGCALCGSLPAMSAARVVQGIGGALMLPAVRVVLLKSVLPKQKLAALNKITLIGLLGTLAGPLLSGLIIMYFSWRLIFLVNLPLCLMCGALAKAYMPHSLCARGAFDLKGFMLVSAAIILLMLGMLGISQDAVPPLGTVTLLAGALGGLLMFKRHHAQTADPLFSLSLFKNRTFSIGIASNFCVRVCLASVPLALTLMLQLEFNYAPLSVSVIMLAFALGAMLSRGWMCQMLERLGYRRLLLATTGFTAAIVVSLTFMPLKHSLLPLAGLIMLVGMLSSILYAAMNTLTFSDLSDNTYHSGNILLTLSQLLSIIVSVTLTFWLLRCFSSVIKLTGLQNYHALFGLMGVGLLMCSLVFRRLKNTDGNDFILGIGHLPEPKGSKPMT